MTDRLSEQRLSEMEARLDAATSEGAEWCFDGSGEKGQGSYIVGIAFDWKDENAEHPLTGYIGDDADVNRLEQIAEVDYERVRNAACVANFIAHAPTDLRAAIVTIRALQAENEMLTRRIAQHKCETTKPIPEDRDADAF